MADEDGEDRILNTEITIGSNIKVMDSQEMEFIEDAYYPNKPLAIQRETIHYPNAIGANKNQFSLKETIVLEDTATPIMQIEKVCFAFFFGFCFFSFFDSFFSLGFVALFSCILFTSLKTRDFPHYFVSLCNVWDLQNLQYFFISILSGIVFLSFVVL